MRGNTIQEKYLWNNVVEGAHRIYGVQPPQDVLDRINMEMKVITENHFTDYILMIWDIHDFCKTPARVFSFCATHGLVPPPDGIVPIGPGRGSVGGCECCYCIGITEVDPLLFGLFFERFLNPERVAYPDIDYDISQKYRYIGLAYIADKYGIDHVSQIITYQTLAVRTVLMDVLKIAGVPEIYVKQVKSTIPEDPSIELSDMLNNEKFMKAISEIPFPDTSFNLTADNINKVQDMEMTKIINSNPEANLQAVNDIRNGVKQEAYVIIKTDWNMDKAIQTMLRLEGLNKNESTHAAGVVVAPVELESHVPLMQKGGKGVIACQYDMHDVEDLGYLKMDALGLRTVDVNHEAWRLVQRWYDPNFDMHNLPFNDKAAIDLIRNGDTVGIFQIESSSFTKMMMDLNIGAPEPNRKRKEFIYEIEKLRGLEIADFSWISAGLALYRPGPLDAILDGKTMVQHLIDRKAGKEAVKYLFSEEENYLGETYGVLVYQEQVMARVRQMTGCSLGRADIFRKAMGKKDPVLMKAQLDWFIESAMKCNFTIDTIDHGQTVNQAADEIKTFARYGFNKAHTVEYAVNCYRNAYFKSHYPLAFYAATLNSFIDDAKRQAVIIRDMLKHELNLLPPTINESEQFFSLTGQNEVRFGLSAIDGLGKQVKALISERDQNGPFKSVEEFRIRIPATVCNVGIMENLAKCGAFDELLSNSLTPISNRATLLATMRDICSNVGKLTKSKIRKKVKYVPTREEAMAGLPNVTYAVTQAQEDLIEYANWEKETLHFYISAHPIDAYTDELERWTSITDTELEDLPSLFYVGGFLADMHELTIKKEGRNKGKKMAFITIETAAKAYELTLFPGIYESCLPYLKMGEPIVAKCKRDFYQGNVSIQGQYIRSLVNDGIRDCPECHIRILHSDNMLKLVELKSLMDAYPGLTEVHLHIYTRYEDIEIRCDQSIALNDLIINKANEIGVISYKPI